VLSELFSSSDGGGVLRQAALPGLMLEAARFETLPTRENRLRVRTLEVRGSENVSIKNRAFQILELRNAYDLQQMTLQVDEIVSLKKKLVSQDLR
jgi:hypothetical protein